MNLNERIATNATKYFGSMWTFWIFCIWAFIPLIPALEVYKETILYISSGFIQLAALPLIMVGQDIMGRTAEIRSQEDHEMIKEQYQNIKEMLEEIKKLHHHTHEMLGTKNDD